MKFSIQTVCQMITMNIGFNRIFINFYFLNLKFKYVLSFFLQPCYHSKGATSQKFVIAFVPFYVFVFLVPKDHFMSEQEWRAVGICQSVGFVRSFFIFEVFILNLPFSLQLGLNQLQISTHFLCYHLYFLSQGFFFSSLSLFYIALQNISIGIRRNLIYFFSVDLFKRNQAK